MSRALVTPPKRTTYVTVDVATTNDLPPTDGAIVTGRTEKVHVSGTDAPHPGTVHGASLHRELEDAGYVEVTKAHRGRVPVTWVALTARDRRAYEEYGETLRA